MKTPLAVRGKRGANKATLAVNSPTVVPANVPVAFTITKAIILGKIWDWIANASENLISADLAILKQNTNAAIATMDTFNVMDYDAYADGVHSDVTAINATIDAASANGGGVVYFPYTVNHYIVDDDITVHSGVWLVGDNALVWRNHNYTVSHNSFIFVGNNVMKGFVWDGGADISNPRVAVVNPEDATEYCNYDEFNSTDCFFYDNTFQNIKGTVIGGRGSNIVYNNTFGDFGDHCVYQGGGYGDETENVIVSDNTFTALTYNLTTEYCARDIFKWRNSGSNIIVANNTINMPGAKSFYFGLQDSGNPQGNMRNLSFAYNHVIACRSIGSVDLSHEPHGETMGVLDNVNIRNNTFDSGNQYILIGQTVGLIATGYSYFANSVVNIKNNVFAGNVPQIYIGCLGTGLTVNLSGNSTSGAVTVTNNTFIVPYGNATINLTDNTLGFTSGIHLFNSPYGYVDGATEGVLATSNQVINILRNTITGVNKVYQEYATYAVFGDLEKSYLDEHITFNLEDNEFSYPTSAPGIGFNGDVTSLVSATFSISDNYWTDTDTEARTDIDDYLSTYLPA